MGFSKELRLTKATAKMCATNSVKFNPRISVMTVTNVPSSAWHLLLGTHDLARPFADIENSERFLCKIVKGSCVREGRDCYH